VAPASYPNFAGKHAQESMFTPADFAAYLRRIGRLEAYQPPAGVVLCYQRSLYDHVLRSEGLQPAERRPAPHGIVLLPSTGGKGCCSASSGSGRRRRQRRWRTLRPWAHRPLFPSARPEACSAT
jgi:hypothetical protein